MLQLLPGTQHALVHSSGLGAGLPACNDAPEPLALLFVALHVLQQVSGLTRNEVVARVILGSDCNNMRRCTMQAVISLA